ncbi:MAG: hypothetical protein QFX35_02160 [Candidatus Verstraetearchaeota archaeon]|nr:hypothetical protein [Candidatus Verstraetearchaeota archaeon]
MVNDKRKTFVARDDLLNGMSEIAKGKGKSLYETVNETFEAAISLFKIGTTPKSALEECGRLKSAKDSGYILCLENLWYDINTLAYNKAASETVAAWRSAGIWYAKKHTTSGTKDPLQSIKKDLQSSLWNVSEFSMIEDRGEVSVRLLGPRLSKICSELFLAFFEGIFEVLGYEVREKEVMAGRVNLIALMKEGRSMG